MAQRTRMFPLLIGLRSKKSLASSVYSGSFLTLHHPSENTGLRSEQLTYRTNYSNFWTVLKDALDISWTLVLGWRAPVNPLGCFLARNLLLLQVRSTRKRIPHITRESENASAVRHPAS